MTMGLGNPGVSSAQLGSMFALNDPTLRLPASDITYPSDNTFSIFSDSIGFNNSVPANDGALNNGCRYLAHGYLNWAAFFSRQRLNFQPIMNWGFPGDDTINLLARIDAFLAGSTATNVILEIGTNDAKGFEANPTVYSLANIIVRLQSIIDKLRAAGKRVFIITPFPRDGSTQGTLSAGAQLILQGIRSYILNLTVTSTLRIVDAWRYMADPASAVGGALSGYTYDGLHPTQTGARAIGLALSEQIGQLYAGGYFHYKDYTKRSANDLYDATNNPRGSLIPNPLLQGSGGSVGGGGSGTLAAGWAGQQANTETIVYTNDVLCADGVRSQRAVLGGTASGAADRYLLIKNPVTASQWQIGDTIEGFCDIEWDADITGISSIGLGIINNSSFLRYLGMDWTSVIASTPMPAFADKGIIRMPRFTLDATAYRFGLIARTIAGTVSGTFRIRSIDLRKVF
jgi:lysophospholipase L1-like esterase